jgi:hypothetical protein
VVIGCRRSLSREQGQQEHELAAPAAGAAGGDHQR